MESDLQGSEVESGDSQVEEDDTENSWNLYASEKSAQIYSEKNLSDFLRFNFRYSVQRRTSSWVAWIWMLVPLPLITHWLPYWPNENYGGHIQAYFIIPTCLLARPRFWNHRDVALSNVISVGDEFWMEPMVKFCWIVSLDFVWYDNGPQLRESLARIMNKRRHNLKEYYEGVHEVRNDLIDYLDFNSSIKMVKKILRRKPILKNLDAKDVTELRITGKYLWALEYLRKKNGKYKN